MLFSLIGTLAKQQIIRKVMESYMDLNRYLKALRINHSIDARGQSTKEQSKDNVS